MNTEEVDPHLTAKLVQSYVRHHKLGPDQLSDLIKSVHRAIGQLGRAFHECSCAWAASSTPPE